jgi:phosphoglycerate kinase
MEKLSVSDLELAGKRLFLRVDFNVPLKRGEVADDQRIRAALPTIRFALEAGASIVLASHLGRPSGGGREPEYSLEPVARRLQELLGRPVGFVDDCIGAEAARRAAELKPGELLLLENLRFHAGEKKPDKQPEFATRLASLADCYVNDAFGTAHRAHASMVAVAGAFDRPAAGFLMAREIEYFAGALTDPRRPFVTILGGAKVSDKIQLIEHLLAKVDALLIGGAMAYTFLAARGVAVGASRVEHERLELARGLLQRATEVGVELCLPVDHLCGREFAADCERRSVDSAEIPEGWMGLDIGPRTIELYREKILNARTVVWNGPMGVFEWEPFSAGTFAVARAAVESEAVSIVGGGDSAAAAQLSGLADRFNHISTGGGASLELLEGRSLPGLAALADRTVGEKS